MKKSGKTNSSPNLKNPKKPKIHHKKHTSIQNFTSEEDYMNYVGLHNKMKNDIIEYFDEPYDYLMGDSNNIITKSTYTKIEYENGMPINEEVYQSQSAKHKDKNGHKITEKHENYKNQLTGEEKISYQRYLDGKGTKEIKKRNLKSGEKEEHNILKGLKENDVKNFNKNYEDFKTKVGFDKLVKDSYLLGNKRNRNEIKVLAIGDGKENERKKSISKKEEEEKTQNKNQSKSKEKNKSKGKEKNKKKEKTKSVPKKRTNKNNNLKAKEDLKKESMSKSKKTSRKKK